MDDIIKEQIWQVLIAFGARNDYKSQFMHHWPQCREFRFQGEFGFGGKIWAPTFGDAARATAYSETAIDKNRLAEINTQLARIAPKLARR